MALHDGQALGHGGQTLGDVAGQQVRLGEVAQVIGDPRGPPPSPSRPPGPLAWEPSALFKAALHGEHPAAHVRSASQPEGKPVLARHRDLALGILPGGPEVLAQLVDQAGEVQGAPARERMVELVGPAQRCLEVPERLGLITLQGPAVGEIAEAGHPGILAVREGVARVAARVVEREAGVQVRASDVDPAAIVQRDPHGEVGLDQQLGAPGLEGDPEELVGDLAGRALVAAHQVEAQGADGCPDQVGNLGQSLGQRPRARIELLHLGGGIAPSHDQRGSEGHLQVQLLPISLTSHGDRREELQTCSQMAHRLDGRRAADSGLRPSGPILCGQRSAYPAACPASAASSSSATMLVILIIGLTAGPAVSL